jgi:hypothetical protein
MTRALLRNPAIDMMLRQASVIDSFVKLDTTQWTSNIDTTGTIAALDAVGGVVSIATAATDDKLSSLHTVKEPFLFTANRPLIGGAQYQYQEVSTNTNNHFIGFMNAFATASMAVAGAGPKTSGSLMGFYKVDGGLNWNVVFGVNGTATTAELTASNSLTKVACPAATASGVFSLLEVEFVPKTTLVGDAIFKIDGRTVYKMMDKAFASSTEMNFGFTTLAGSGGVTTLLIDGCYAEQLGPLLA